MFREIPRSAPSSRAECDRILFWFLFTRFMWSLVSLCVPLWKTNGCGFSHNFINHVFKSLSGSALWCFRTFNSWNNKLQRISSMESPVLWQLQYAMLQRLEIKKSVTLNTLPTHSQVFVQNKQNDFEGMQPTLPFKGTQSSRRGRWSFISGAAGCLCLAVPHSGVRLP